MMNRNKSLLTALALLAASSVAIATQAHATAVSVFKTPWCGCCHDWAGAVGRAGYEVTAIDLEDLSPVRKQAGVPADMEGCHVAIVEGYFLEGHVPLEAIARMLAEKPDIAGIAVPGMPEGSLGMGDDPRARYEVYAIPRDRKAAPFLFHRMGG